MFPFKSISTFLFLPVNNIRKCFSISVCFDCETHSDVGVRAPLLGCYLVEAYVSPTSVRLFYFLKLIQILIFFFNIKTALGRSA